MPTNNSVAAATSSTADVLQTSLTLQRARLEAAAQRIAGANVALAPEFAAALQPGDMRLALEPGHPAADASGIVRYPNVDVATEMSAMLSSSRAYEASLRAYNLLKNMNGAALEIGK